MAILGRLRGDARATPLLSPEAQSGQPPSQSSVIEVTVMMDSFWKTCVEHCKATRSMWRFSARSTLHSRRSCAAH